MPTIWNSYSKSETARRPRTIIAGADPLGIADQQRVEGIRTAIVARPSPASGAVSWRTISSRSSSVNIGDLEALVATPITR